MKKTNLDFIQSLSLLDEKTLSQKALKLFEEGGELSKKVLPYDNAHGTLHRFVDRASILEEVADCILVARSIAYELQFSHEDIEEMIMRKSISWANLHKREAKMENKLPFEIHVTVEKSEQDYFVKTCQILGVKPIIIAMQANQKQVNDVMTSSVFIGSNRGAMEELERVSAGLKDAGLKVIREKIETVPWHTAAPSKEFNNPVMPINCYFESHLGIKIKDDKEDIQKNKLSEFCSKNELHLSRNAFKMDDSGSYTIMATYRLYSGYSEDFIDTVEKLRSGLSDIGFEVEKVITEFSIYDTKVSHDSEWLKR